MEIGEQGGGQPDDAQLQEHHHDGGYHHQMGDHDHHHVVGDVDMQEGSVQAQDVMAPGDVSVTAGTHGVCPMPRVPSTSLSLKCDMPPPLDGSDS